MGGVILIYLSRDDLISMVNEFLSMALKHSSTLKEHSLFVLYWIGMKHVSDARVPMLWHHKIDKRIIKLFV